MGWTERQRDMLAAMGLRLWSAPEPPAEAGPAATSATEPAAAASVAEPAPTRAAAEPAPTVPAAGPAAARAAGRALRAPGAKPVPHLAQAAAGFVAAEPGAGAADERSAAIRQMSWDGLRQAVAECRACGLCESRRQTVFGVGHPQAAWMIVGEAPGEQEDAQGEPFVGPAGQLLDQMLAALGLSRAEGAGPQQVFIANTLKCRPPRNRNPAPEEMALCAPFLSRQIALVQPRLILAMGRFAIQHLLATDEAVGRLRGRVHQHAGVPVVVTYHPAYLLRQPADKRKAWDDLCLAAEVASSGRTADPAG